MKNNSKSPSEIHKNHRYRMKQTYFKNGFEVFSDIEKLEFILYYAIGRKDTNPIAHALLDEFKTFDGVLDAPIETLMQIDGVGEHTAILLHLFVDVLNAYGKTKCEPTVGTTSQAKKYASNLFNAINVEQFYVVCLNTANKVLALKKINSGTSSEVNVCMKDITATAIKNNCERIMLIHNHPNGNVAPSDEDLSFTAKIVLSCTMNDIEVIDHIIVAGDKQFSFIEANIMQELKRDSVRKYARAGKINEVSSNYKIG